MVMSRTNVVVDDELLELVMNRYGFKTKREAIDYALKSLVGHKRYKIADMLDLRGIGWEGDLNEMRRTRFPDW